MSKILITLTFFLVIIPAIDSIGCSCRSVRSVEDEYKHQQIVTVGKIIKKEIISRIDSLQFNKFLADGKTIEEMDKRIVHYQYLKFKLVVQESFKGITTKDTIDIYTAVGSASCGINFTVGQNYIIYGSSSTYFPSSFFPNREYPYGKNMIWANLCSRTRLSDKKEIDKLRKLAKK